MNPYESLGAGPGPYEKEPVHVTASGTESNTVHVFLCYKRHPFLLSSLLQETGNKLHILEVLLRPDQGSRSNTSFRR